MEENMNNNSSSNTTATTTNNSIRHICTSITLLHSSVCWSIGSMPRDTQPKNVLWLFSGSAQASRQAWPEFHFFNRSSLLLNFTRHEFGNGTSTVKHDYQIRLFQVILNFMNRSCFFLCSLHFVSYRIAFQKKRYQSWTRAKLVYSKCIN